MRHVRHTISALCLLLTALPIACSSLSDESDEPWALTEEALESSTTIFGSRVPSNAVEPNDTQPVELGVKFRSSVSGTVSAIRFYRGARSRTGYTASLWRSDGTKLASAAISNDPQGSGWRQITFASPVAIAANTTYVASYYAPEGRYAFEENGLASAVTSGPLTALASGSSGGNGVYTYARGGGFPRSTHQNTNYFVDVVFASSTSTQDAGTPPPSPTDAGAPPPSGTTTFPPRPPSPGATYVVAKGGNDGGPCTDAQPCATITGGLAKLKKTGGDRLLVKDGTYTDNVWGPNIEISGFSGSPTSWTTIAAYPGHRPKIFVSNLQPNGNPVWQNINIQSSSYVHIEGFEIAGDKDAARGETNNVYIRSSNYIDVWANDIHHASGSGVASQLSDHVDIRGNRIHDNADWSCYGQSGISLNNMRNQPGGPDANGYGNKIVGNLLWNNQQLVNSTCIGQSYITDGNCIIFDLTNDTGYSSKSLVKNNICVSTGSRCLHALASDNVDWIRNTCYLNMKTSDPKNGESGEITITYSRNHRFEGNLVVPRSSRDPWRDWTNATSTMSFVSNVFVKTGFNAPSSNNLVLPNGTRVLQSPNETASLGDWTVVGAAVGSGAPWPLDPR